MSQTETKTQTDVPQGDFVDVPQGDENLPATNDDASPKNRAEGYEKFSRDLQAKANEISTQLPTTLTRDKFINASLAAVRANPDILVATPRSLMAAVIKAAQDGLLPDGREGVITVYSTEVKGQGRQNIAQWNPMIFGIRKRARELDTIIIDTAVVYKGDGFEYELGDNAFIRHKPKDRGEEGYQSDDFGVAAWAIFRHATEGVLHREVMWRGEIFVTRAQSRGWEKSLMWTKFWTEGWRKTVARRGSKSVPVSEDLTRLIQRDDENFDFGDDNRIRLPAASNVGARVKGGTPITISYASGKPADTLKVDAEAQAHAEGAPAAEADQTAKDTGQPDKGPTASSVPPPAGSTLRSQLEGSAKLAGEEASIVEDLRTALAKDPVLTQAKLDLIHEEFDVPISFGTEDLKHEADLLFEAAKVRII